MPHPFPYSIKRHGTTLEECDHEPVQTPGCVQAHGVLFVLRPADLTVLQVSENSGALLGMKPEELLNQPLALSLGPTLAEAVRDALAHEMLERTPLFIQRFSAPRGGRVFDACLHRNGDVVLLELEIAPEREGLSLGEPDFYGLVRKSLSRFQAAVGLKQLAQAVTEELRRETQLDRVMVYFFHADDSGEVIAEAKRDDLNSWLGWRYPSHDIPKPAREIFKKIWSRPVPEVSAPLSEMVPLADPVTGEALDMTYCSLRGASIMYTEYLANMGVAAALTLPLLMEGELWGLIACHHYSPKPLPYRLRAAAEFLAKGASQQMQLAEEREANAYRVNLETKHQGLISRMVFNPSFDVFVTGTPNLLSAMDAKGAALFYGTWFTLGDCPGRAQLTELGQWLMEKKLNAGPGTIYSTDHLEKEYAPAAEFSKMASGVLAFSFSPDPMGVVIWFRPETLQTFTWAGNPNELPLTSGPHGHRLTPRRSFEIWREEVRARSLPWKRVEIAGARSLARLMSDLLVGHWLRQREAERSVMEAADRLRIAVEAANLGTWDYYPVTGALRWSARCRELFGVSPQSEVTLDTFFATLHPADRDGTAAAIRVVLDPANRERFDREFRSISPDGTIRWVRAIGQTFADEAGQIVRFAGTVQDITERVRARDQLEARGEELQALVDARTKELRQTIGELEAFSYSVSHDMRSPLLAMQGFSQALREEYADRLDEIGLDYLQRIERGSRRLDMLVQDVLAFSKISQSGSLLSRIALGPLMDDLIDGAPELHEPNATVHNAVGHAEVLGHEAMLIQVLGNLLGNAVKFRKPEVHPVVVVSIEKSPERVRVLVTDNGIGVGEQDRERIFRIFERLNPKTMFEGTGIGLAIVKKAVERMGGNIGVHANPAGGSTFWFELNVPRESASPAGA
jgi:PAS domain S-box-containing protein